MNRKLRILVNSILTASLAISGTIVGAAPAFADKYDGDNAPKISLTQVPNSGTPPILGDSPAGPNCNQPFPANPVVECGFITFADTMIGTPSRSLRSSSGHPKELWSNSLGRVFSYDFNLVKDNYLWLNRTAKDYSSGAEPTNNLRGALSTSAGANMRYYSRGVNWKDSKTWTQETTITRKVVNVTVPPPTKTVTPGYWSGKGKTRKWNPQVVTITPSPPVYVDTLIIKDSIFDRTGTTGKNFYSSQAVTVTTITYKPFWLTRSVSHGGVAYYSTPETKQIWCQTELGPGQIVGPYDHDLTPLNSKIGVADSDLDAQTILRQWWTKPPPNLAASTKLAPGGGFILMAPIGTAIEKTPSIFKRGNSAALSLVNNCVDKKPSYIADATNQPCKVLEPTSPLYGKELPASHELCQAFVPGNYNKDLSDSKETLCTIVNRTWIGSEIGNPMSNVIRSGPGGIEFRLATWSPASTFIHCGEPMKAENNPARSSNATYYPTMPAFFSCDGDTPRQGNGMYHPDKNYNFLTCGMSFVCEVPGGNKSPTITDVNSNTSTRGTSQVLASGAQSRVTWAKPTGIGVIDRSGRRIATIAPDESKSWQSWTVLPGSTPWNFGKDPNDNTQPIFGSNTLNASPNGNNSVINSGVNGWANPAIYLRGYKGTNVATSNTRIGDLLVRSGDLIPFALYTEYNATTPRETTVFGRRVTMNMPVTCEMPPAYLYFLSGRATG